MTTLRALPCNVERGSRLAALCAAIHAPVGRRLLASAVASFAASCSNGSSTPSSISAGAGMAPWVAPSIPGSGGTSSGGAMTTTGAPTVPGNHDVSAGGAPPASGGIGAGPPSTAGAPIDANGGASISGAGMGGTTGGGATSGGSGGAIVSEGGSAAGGAETGASEDATIVPDSQWACGMAEGIPSPTMGELAFTITLDIRDEHEVGNTPYGYRRLLDVGGGTITGDRLQGSVLSGGLEYELTLSNGVMEYQGINILDTSDGRVFVRSCGVATDGDSGARIIPDFEATTSSGNAFLNTGTWVATREVADGKMTLAVYDVSDVTPGEPRVQITKPDGVPPQPWECNTTSGSQGPEVFTENVTLGGSFSIDNAKYGSRNVIPITGGTTSGRVNGTILDGGADYQLSGSLDAWYTLAPDNGEIILVRNCGGAGGLIPWFEAAVDGEFDFLNTQAYLSSPPGVGGGGVSITFYERQ